MCYSFSDRIRPVKLAEQDEPIPTGAKGVVSGWGVISSVAPILSKDLRATTIPVMSKTVCQMDYMMIRITERQFCAGYFAGGRDACNGDSGGPFVIDNKLFGIVSWGFYCAQAGSPGVYTSIPALRNYIRVNSGV
nr:unnamed protein product [Callosobruchus analis]